MVSWRPKMGDIWTEVELPDSWQKVSLAQICTVIRGGSPRPMGDPRYFGGDIPFIKISDVTKSNGFHVYESETKVNEAGASKSRLLNKGELILSNSGTVCVPVFLGVPACIHDGFVAFEGLSERIHRKLLFYFFKYIRPYIIDKHKQGVTQVNLNTTIVGEIELLLPPENEQHRIVARIEELFSELDKGIESLKTAREQLKVYRQALLKHAFEGKLTEQWRQDNADKLETADQLLERIKQEREARYQQQLEEWKAAVKQWEADGKEGKKPRRPASFKELPPIAETELDALPALPETWTYHRLAEISQIGSGMSVSKSRKLGKPVEVPYLRVANVQRGGLVLDEVKTMLIEEEKLKDHLLEKWDVLFNEGGDRDKLGRGWVWESQIGQCITQNHVFRATTYLGGEVHSKFVSHWGNTHGQDYFDKGGKQTTNLASINKTVLSMFPVPMPPVEEQEQIITLLEEKMSTLDSFESDIDKSLRMSEALRQSILKKPSPASWFPKTLLMNPPLSC